MGSQFKLESEISDCNRLVAKQQKIAEVAMQQGFQGF